MSTGSGHSVKGSRRVSSLTQSLELGSSEALPTKLGRPLHPIAEEPTPSSASSSPQSTLAISLRASVDSDYDESIDSGRPRVYIRPIVNIPDRSKWLELLESTSPAIRDVRRRVRPLTRTLDFARTYEIKPRYPESLVAAVAPQRNTTADQSALVAALLQRPETIEPQMVMLLVLEHLQFLNMHRTLSVLLQELQKSGKFHALQDFDPTDADPYAHDRQESRLVTCLRSAMRCAHQIWDYTMADKFLTPDEYNDKLYELLYSMGLFGEDSYAYQAEVDIWSEPKEGTLVLDTYATVEEGEPQPIRAASLNRLVEELTGHQMPDMTFMSTFLLTYRSFTTPRLLLEKLKQRFNVPKEVLENRSRGNSSGDDAQWVKTIQLRIISFLKKWVEEYSYDIDPSVATEMKAFVEEAAFVNPTLAPLCNSLLRNLQQPVKKIKTVTNQTMPPPPKVPKDIFSPTLSLYSVDPEEVARQLALMDFEVFASIKPSELLNQCWNKPHLRHRAPNVLKMIHRFNQLSHSISTHIIQPTRIKQRAKALEFWLKVAEHCRSLNNFHGMMAVVSGINAGPVLRLKYTRAEVARSLMESFESLESIMESDGSFATYRSLLQQTSPPCIPHLGIHLTDLVFIEDGNNDLDGNLINFAKRRLLASSIMQLRRFQSQGYNFQPVHQIQELINRLKPLEMRELYKLSLKREPREAQRSQLT